MTIKNVRSKNTKGKPNELDVEIGQNLLAVRQSFNISQEVVATGMNLTFQQIQKYEKGMNRVSTSRLCEFARFFKVNIHVFLPKEFQGDTSKAFHTEHEHVLRMKNALEQIHKISKSPGK